MGGVAKLLADLVLEILLSSPWLLAYKGKITFVN
jgi:hypothetical protein